MMKERTGDLLQLAEQGEFDVIVHGCNCFHTFGAGIAKAIRLRWPETHRTDVTETAYGDVHKLGTITITDVSDKLTVINAYTQFSHRQPGPNVEYEAVASAFRAIKDRFGNRGLRFGIPKIGAGLGGGDWNTIYNIIDPIMAVEDVTVVVLP